MSTKITALAALAVMGLAATAQSASAQNAGANSVTVRYADLNLSTEAGAQVMLERIRQAAKAACAAQTLTPSDFVYEYPVCVRHAYARAVASFDNPVMTALSAGHGRPAMLAASGH